MAHLSNILLTGLGDYEKNGVIIRNNPSQLAVEKFVSRYRLFKNFNVIGAILDANNREVAGNQVRKLLDQHHPAVCLSLGMKTVGTESLLLEEQAMDINDQGLDLRTKIKIGDIVSECYHQGVKAKISCDAGSGTCNLIYYVGLKHIEDAHLETVMVFVHLPLLPETMLIGKNRTPEVSLEEVHRAISIILTYALRGMGSINN